MTKIGDGRAVRHRALGLRIEQQRCHEQQSAVPQDPRGLPVVLNNDTRTHNVRVFADALDFDSGAQEPGETVEIAFPQPQGNRICLSIVVARLDRANQYPRG